MSKQPDSYWVGYLRQQVRHDRHILQEALKELRAGKAHIARAFLEEGLREIERTETAMMVREAEPHGLVYPRSPTTGCGDEP